MNQLSSKQRKGIYLAALIVLFVPIFIMGRPSEGMLARERQENLLGEATLGNVDPASSTLNLVLLGMRGVAANLLWMEADHLKETKNWSELQQRIDSIILLQPHFEQVWRYQSWNLAYNVSAECDRVADRYFWVKEGIKFIIEGTQRNAHIPELFHDTGYYIGNKIGLSDERAQFRRYFLDDPKDELYEDGPDEELNPNSEDNYLVAREWYLEANSLVDGGYEQHKMAEELFVAYPHRAIISYARAMQTLGDPLTGLPDWDKARSAWAQAYLEWTTDFGRRQIEVPIGDLKVYVQLEPTDDASYEQMLAEQPEEFTAMVSDLEWNALGTVKAAQHMAQSNSGYHYWRMRCDIEQREEMASARQNYFEGKQQYYEPPQDFARAQQSLYSAMESFQVIVTEYPELIATSETDILEDAMKSVIIWQDIVLNKLPDSENPDDLPALPEDYPLKEMWEDPDYTAIKDEYMRQFHHWVGAGL